MNPKKLLELEPVFIHYVDQYILFLPSTYIDHAQGLCFTCPLCENHSILISFADRGVLDHQGMKNKEGKSVHWKISGTSFHDLTCSPSIELQGGCNWHGFIENGIVR